MKQSNLLTSLTTSYATHVQIKNVRCNISFIVLCGLCFMHWFVDFIHTHIPSLKSVSQLKCLLSRNRFQNSYIIDVRCKSFTGWDLFNTFFVQILQSHPFFALVVWLRVMEFFVPIFKTMLRNIFPYLEKRDDIAVFRVSLKSSVACYIQFSHPFIGHWAVATNKFPSVEERIRKVGSIIHVHTLILSKF